MGVLSLKRYWCLAGYWVFGGNREEGYAIPRVIGETALSV